MVIMLKLKDGTELISKQVRQETIADGLMKPYYQLTINMRQGNEFTIDELEKKLTKENLETIEVYRRESFFNQETQEESFGEFEFQDKLVGFDTLKFINKDFYSQQICVVIKKES